MNHDPGSKGGVLHSGVVMQKSHLSEKTLPDSGPSLPMQPCWFGSEGGAEAAALTRSERMISVDWLSWGVTRLGGCIGLVLLLSSCSLVFDPELKTFSDYGERCNESNECASGICLRNRCSTTCSSVCPPDIEARCVNGTCSFLGPPALEATPAVAFLYNGVIEEDGVISGTIKAQDLGRLEIEAELDGVKTIGVEGVTANDVQDQIDILVEQGFNIIIGTNADHRTPLSTAANRHLNMNFLQYGVYSDSEAGYNIGSYMGRMYLVMYLLGRAAARKTRTDRVGVVAPVALPETVRNINSFALGVAAEDENIPVVVRWINNWSDDELEPRAVEELTNMECDIILGYTDTTRVLEKAVEIGTTPMGEDIYVIGYGTENTCGATSAVKSRCISSAYWNWGPMLVGMLQKMQTGEWIPDRYWEQMINNREESSVHYTLFNPAIMTPADTLDIDNQVDELSNNPMLPWERNIWDTSGERHSNIDDDDLMRMCWHVRGVKQISSSDPPVLEDLVDIPASCRAFSY